MPKRAWKAWGRHRFKQMSDARPGFRIGSPEPQVADFTAICTARVWLSVAVGLDLFSPWSVGWSMKAEQAAFKIRLPQPYGDRGPRGIG